MKQQSQRQRGLYREIRVTSLCASPTFSARNPTGNRIFAEPDRDVASIAEPLLVLRPIRDRIFGLVLRVYETGRACCHWISSYEICRLTDSLDRHILGVKRDSCTNASLGSLHRS